MSWTFVACVLISFVWMGLFLLWGRTFLTIIHADWDVASSIVFGYLVLQVLYQVIYLPFYLSRGSYRAVSYIWLGIMSISSVFLLLFLRKHSTKRQRKKRKEIIGIFAAGILILGLAFYISLHAPFYGADTVKYISTMNESLYRDSIWVTAGSLHFHFGMCSMFHMFTISSLLTGIRPYYISLFTIRTIGICMSSLILYRTGRIIFGKNDQRHLWLPLVLSVIVPCFLMFWGSMYTAEFFYWRINEAKGFCQFVLLPLGFSVFLSMFKKNANRNLYWKQQLLVGVAAVPVSSSALTPYMFLVFLGTVALLSFDKLHNGWKTMRYALLCVLPNVAYLVVYILEKAKIIML